MMYRRSKMLAAVCSAIVLFVIAMFRNAILARLQGQESAAGFATLSGRTVAWAAALRQWHQHPLLGSGGGVGGKLVIENLGDVSLEKISSLHNGFLELLLGLGAVGFLIGVYLLLLATWRAWEAWRAHPEYAGTYVLIVHAWLATIMSTGVLGWMGYEMAFYLCILTNLDLLQRQPILAPVAAYRAAREEALTVAYR
jgi:O-antigen ligase